MTLSEALAARELTYSGWSDCKLKADARGDILRYLNCLTDQEHLSLADMEAIALLSKAAHHLEPEDGEESSVEAMSIDDADEHTTPDWAKGYPVIWDRFHTLKHAFCDFMAYKYVEGDGSALLANVFTAHRALVNAILSMTNVTEQEKAVVASAVKR